jgi:hypothetical protein
MIGNLLVIIFTTLVIGFSILVSKMKLSSNAKFSILIAIIVIIAGVKLL